MKKKLKIGLDLDGVIIDHTSSRLLKAKELGYALKPENTQSEVIKSFVSPEHHREIQKYIYGQASINAPIMDGANECIRKLANSNMLFIISRRNVDEGGDKLGLKWLESNGLLTSIPKDKIIFVPHEEKGAKNIVAKNFGIEIYLDDQLKILEEMPDVRHRVLFDQHNVFTPPFPYTKVINWSAFAGFINNLINNLKK